jgi:hypothetical protein
VRRVFEIAVVTGNDEQFLLGAEVVQQRSEKGVEVGKDALGRAWSAPMTSLVGEVVLEEREGVIAAEVQEPAPGLGGRAARHVEIEVLSPSVGGEVGGEGAAGVEVGAAAQANAGSPRGACGDGPAPALLSVGEKARRVGIGKSARRFAFAEARLDFVEDGPLGEDGLGRGVRERAEVAPGALRAVFAGEERGLAGAALGEAVRAQSCVNEAKDVVARAEGRGFAGPVVPAGECSKGR